MALDEEISRSLLAETRRTRERVEALTSLLAPASADEDPIAVLIETLRGLTAAVQDTRAEVAELRIEIGSLADRGDFG